MLEFINRLPASCTSGIQVHLSPCSSASRQGTGDAIRIYSYVRLVREM